MVDSLSLATRGNDLKRIKVKNTNKNATQFQVVVAESMTQNTSSDNSRDPTQIPELRNSTPVRRSSRKTE